MRYSPKPSAFSRFMTGFCDSFFREVRKVSDSRWDLFALFGIPLLVIVLFGSMFIHTKAEHLPIMVVDRDQSELSHHIIRHISHHQSLDAVAVSQNPQDAERAINTLDIGGYLYIPKNAETRLVNAEDPGLLLVYNQALYSMGSGSASAMSSAALSGVESFLSESYLVNTLPSLHLALPTIKVTILFNPTLSYELFLSPFVVAAVLHLLLSCLVAYAIGTEFADGTASDWLKDSPIAALLGKVSLYTLVIILWAAIWLTWMIWVRQYAIAGSALWLMMAQVLFYGAYALFGAMVALVVRDANKSFGLLAVYGGSSMSFAGVSLPLNNAPTFTQFWSNIIPFTSFAKLQTQSWIIGSPWQSMLPNLLILLLFVILFGSICLMLVRKIAHNLVTDTGASS
ncbi:ABC transporter permease [uncultured Moraxella sp.]|uniref:ABC transporter permease n=1 Tax=uncultured Moraxella sp. TaxID=263769 RepID=UPI0025DF07BF|nr:ABC transporter permease [uncultured Moraxella sp.]